MLKLYTFALSLFGALFLPSLAIAQSNIQIGSTGKTYASSSISCILNPATGLPSPTVETGLYNPKKNTHATVFLNGNYVADVNATNFATALWLSEGNNLITITLNKNTTDTYSFNVTPAMCIDTQGNTFNLDHSIEYAASNKSYATVTPACAYNPLTNTTQPFINLFNNGTYLLNVSVNGVPLTQLSAFNLQTSVFLSSGTNIITANNGTLSTDYYVRNGGAGSCSL